MKNILYWFIEGQTYFDMPRGAKMILTLNEPKVVALHSDSNTDPPSMHQKLVELFLILYAKQPMEYQRKSLH